MTTTLACPTETNLEAILQMTASGLDLEEDDEFISFNLNSIMQALFSSVKSFQPKDKHIIRLCLKCFINLTGSSSRCLLLHKFDLSCLNQLVSKLTALLLLNESTTNDDEEDLSFSELAASLICNLTRDDTVFLKMFVNNVDIEKLVHEIVQGYDKPKSDKLPHVLLNFSQEESVRLKLCSPQHHLMKQLTPFTRIQFNHERRAAIAGLIKNCCFNDDYHSYLISEEVGLLSALVIPLSGPRDVVDDEDRAALPTIAQSFPGRENTVREPDISIRICHCESLLQLCSTPECRSLLKASRIYAILRELHKWECESIGLLAIEQVVDILIGDDPPDELAHLRKVEIPEDIAKNIHKSNEVFLKDDDNDNLAVEKS